MTLTPITDDVPAVFTPRTHHDTDSWTLVVGEVVRLAQEIAGTDFVPKGIRNSVPATAAAMLYGREVGLPPMTALTSIHVIDGRPGMAAEGMRALVLAAGHDLVFDEATGASCRMRARRAGSTAWTSLAWTLDMARAAGLTGKDNWKRYPRAMLIARCSADLCRMVFPDVIHGFRSLEELVDMDDTGESAAELTPVAPARTVQRETRRQAAARRRPVEDVELPTPPTPPSPGPPLPGEEEETPQTVGGSVAPDAAPTREDGPSAAKDAGPRRANRAQLRMLHIQFRRLGLDDDRAERLALTSALAGREITTSSDLTAEEVDAATVTISTVSDADALRALIAKTEEAAVAQAEAEAEAEADTPLDEPEEES